jgi:hypothetical protein
MPKHPHRNHDEEWTIEKVLKAMEGPAYPDFLLELVAQVQEWMESTLSGEGIAPGDEAFYSYGDRIFQGDMDGLAGRLEWLESKADLLPSAEGPQGRDEAVVLCLGPIDFEEGMRLAVDHAALFGRGYCKRVWLIGDSWHLGEVTHYIPHVKALAAQGAELRFLLVTPWGWTEIPVGAPAQAKGSPWKWEGKNHLRGLRNDEGL